MQGQAEVLFTEFAEDGGGREFVDGGLREFEGLAIVPLIGLKDFFLLVRGVNTQHRKNTTRNKPTIFSTN